MRAAWTGFLLLPKVIAPIQFLFPHSFLPLYLSVSSFPSSATPFLPALVCFSPASCHPSRPRDGKRALLLAVGTALMEKAMATHSSTVARKIPWLEELGRLQSMGSLRVRHDWVTSLSLSTFMHWKRKWQPTPVFLPGESHGRRSLVGCSPWGRTESDTTEAT